MANLRSVSIEAPSEHSVGDTWLYWDPRSRRHRRVEIVESLGSGAKKVRIQHLDPEMRSLREWVPIGRCRAPWDARSEFLAYDERWGRIMSHAPRTGVVDTASTVLDMVLPEEIAHLRGNGAGGVLEALDLPDLSLRTGVSEDDLTAHPDSFREDGRWYLPWPSTFIVLQRLARRHSARLIEYVVTEEADSRRRAIGAVEGHPLFPYQSPSEREERVAMALGRVASSLSEQRQLILAWAVADATDLAANFEGLLSAYRGLVAASVPALGQVRQIRSKKAAAIASELEQALVKYPGAAPGTRFS